MVKEVQNKALHTCIPPMLFLGAAVLAGSSRLIEWFGPSRKGLFTAAGLGGLAAGGSQLVFEESDYKRYMATAAGLALSAISIPYAAKALLGRADIGFKGSFRFAGIEALLVGGYEVYSTNGNKPKMPFDNDDYDMHVGYARSVLSRRHSKIDTASHEAIVEDLKTLEKNGFFKEKSQERAKAVFKGVMKAMDGGEVTYVTAENWKSNKTDKALDLSIFQWSVTNGVENDIPKAALDGKRIHLFSVASQYNGAEAPSVYTPPVGEAMVKSDHDHTQGPLSRRTNPVLFEMSTAFLTHLGFNMMDQVLLSAGKTYKKDSAIEHGYLRPSDKNVLRISNEMFQNYTKIEVPCYESRPNKKNPIYLILGAAPAIGYSSNLDKNGVQSKILQTYAYKANFITQFKQALTLLKAHPDKEIVLHITGTGLGVFGCDVDIFKEEFQEVALEFQAQLSEDEKKRMHVQLESYKGSDYLHAASQNLGLGEAKDRIE